MKRLLIICPYPFDESPSQRFRFEQYIDILEASGIKIDFNSFWDEKTFRVLYLKSQTFQKIVGFIKGWLRRFFLLLKVGRYNYIFIHREAAPVGPPVIEWLLAKVFRKKIIYDFDDAIWLPNTSESNSFISRLKWHSKVKSVCKWSYKVSCGNDYLAAFAKKYSTHVQVVPTTVDTDFHIRKENKESESKIIIGWTGTQSTNYYLKQIEPVLKRLSAVYDFELRIISNQPPSIDFPYKFIKWNKATEVEDLLPFDIGVMPLPDDEWAKGKCGFKLIQYLSLNIPSVASPVGVNVKIIEEMTTGLLAISEDEWYNSLAMLLSDSALRYRLGANGRKRIEEKYSKKANKDKYLNLLS